MIPLKRLFGSLRRFSLLCFVCLGLLYPPQSFAVSSVTRVGLLIAHNGKGSGSPYLRFAVSDAYKMKDVLTQVAGYKPSQLYMSINEDRKQLQKLFTVVKRKIQSIRQKSPKKKIVLFVFYSGHAKSGEFLLGADRMNFSELKAFLKSSGATLRLAFLDTCSSGLFLKTRGLRRMKRSFRIPLLNTQTTDGEAIITSTGARENAYEDLKLRGGIFTHFMTTGLRGAADRNRDGRVTLHELYSYTYSRTINRTIFARSGPQKPHFRTNLQGAGEVILSTTYKHKTTLRLRKQLGGHFFIWDKKKVLYAGFYKKPSQDIQLAMKPGRYTIQWRHEKKVFTTRVKLDKQKTFYLSERQGKLASLQTYARRGGPPADAEWEVLQPSEDEPRWSLWMRAGVAGGSYTGGTLMGGGALGIQHTFFSLQLGVWGTSVAYQASNQLDQSTQLHVDLRASFGYRWVQPTWSLYTGMYAGSGLLFQDLNLETAYAGPTLHAGLTLVPAYHLGERWELTLQWNAGADFGVYAGEWKAFFHWSVLVGVQYRL